MAAVDMRKETALLALLMLGAAGHAAAVVSVSVVDGTSSLGEVAPVSGSASVLRSTTDGLRFSSEGSTEAQLVVVGAAHTFAYDRGGAPATSSVSYQGVTTPLSDVLFAAQTSGGAFLPLRVVTSADLTGQAGWTKASGCGSVTYQGSFSIAWQSNAGLPQAPLTRYYQACDSAAELYVDADKDLSSGADLAYVSTAQRVLPDEADYEVVIQGTDFAFASAASGGAVTLQQGRYTPNALTSGASYLDLYFLYRFPDGFPAGVATTILTATALDITV